MTMDGAVSKASRLPQLHGRPMVTRSPAQAPSARLPASTGLTPAACTAIRTWPGPATGSAA